MLKLGMLFFIITGEQLVISEHFALPSALHAAASEKQAGGAVLSMATRRQWRVSSVGSEEYERRSGPLMRGLWPLFAKHCGEDLMNVSVS